MSACGRAGVAPQPPGLRDQPGPPEDTRTPAGSAGGGGQRNRLNTLLSDPGCQADLRSDLCLSHLQESGSEVFLDSIQTPEPSGRKGEATRAAGSGAFG